MVARSAIVTDVVSGQRFGVVGATTPDLPTISSPRGVVVTPDLAATALVVQAEIDRLTDQHGVEKIVFVSHLQNVANDLTFIPLLDGIDIAVAGGGDDLLVNPVVPLDVQLLPGEAAPVAGDYPLEVTDGGGRTVYIVTTAGNYKYLAGSTSSSTRPARWSRSTRRRATRVASFRSAPSPRISACSTRSSPDEAIVEDVVEPVEECLEALATPLLRSEIVFDTSRAGSRTRETSAGNAITDAYLAAYDRFATPNGLPPRGAGNPVIALQNGGGIRQNGGDVLPVGGASEISRLNTLNVLPFFNSMTW